MCLVPKNAITVYTFFSLCIITMYVYSKYYKLFLEEKKTVSYVAIQYRIIPKKYVSTRDNVSMTQYLLIFWVLDSYVIRY